MMHGTPPVGFSQTFAAARLRLLRLYHEAHSGHIGGSLSCLDALLTLQLAVMTDADRFVLSKGHAAGALYVALWAKGLLPEETLATFCGEGTVLPGHPSGTGIPGLLFPTGSLGHGPSLAAGLALALKRKEQNGTVYCLCSDGEWQEGSCWEALAFAVRQGLGNLCLLVDQNGWQGFGSTQEVMGISDLTPRLEAFGASVVSLDGHAPESILSALAPPPPAHLYKPDTSTPASHSPFPARARAADPQGTRSAFREQPRIPLSAPDARTV